MIVSRLLKARGRAGFEIWADEGAIEEWKALFNTETLRDQLAALFSRVAESGPPRNDKLNNILDPKEKIYELKPGPIRLPYFYAEQVSRAIVVTHGFRKKSQKAPRREIARAIRVRKAYREALASGSLVTKEGA